MSSGVNGSKLFHNRWLHNDRSEKRTCSDKEPELCITKEVIRKKLEILLLIKFYLGYV